MLWMCQVRSLVLNSEYNRFFQISCSPQILFVYVGVEALSEEEEEEQQSDGDGQENVALVSAAVAKEEAMMEMDQDGPFRVVL